MNLPKAKKIFLFTLVLLGFFLSYYRNFWGVVDKKEFNDFDIYSQSQVLGRVIRAEKEGIFSEGGLNGWVRDDSVMKDMDWDAMTYFQFEIYRKNPDLGKTEFIIYDSQLGGQGILFSLLDKISPLNNKTNLSLFWLINSLSLAFIMTVFVSWVYKLYGYNTSFITFILLLISPWLTLWGRNLYMVYFSFYLPFILMLMILHKESERKSHVTSARLLFLSAALVFFKLFFSGFEFITAFLVMFTIPLFFHWFADRWEIRRFIKRFALMVSGAVAGIIAYSALYSYQLSTLKGSFWYGAKYMLYCFLKRTHGNSSDFPEGFKASLDSGTFEVLRMYFKTDAIKFGLFGINFLSLFIILIVFTFLIIYSRKISPSINAARHKNLPLLLTTWVSLIGPLSWLVVFKAHAFVHTYYDEIVWYMPFCLFFFALAGNILPGLIKDINGYIEKNGGTE